MGHHQVRFQCQPHLRKYTPIRQHKKGILCSRFMNRQMYPEAVRAATPFTLKGAAQDGHRYILLCMKAPFGHIGNQKVKSMWNPYIKKTRCVCRNIYGCIFPPHEYTNNSEYLGRCVPFRPELLFQDNFDSWPNQAEHLPFFDLLSRPCGYTHARVINLCI